MSMKFRIYIVLMLATVLTAVGNVNASHIVGGEFQYICLNDQVSEGRIKYRVTFKLYMDCLHGLPGAIDEEDSTYFVSYSVNDVKIADTFWVGAATKRMVPANFENECVTDPPITCLLMYAYSFDVNLPNRKGGYYLATNNCCRNETIINIGNPDQTGASYYVTLPERLTTATPEGYNNHSAVFKEVPPQIICLNNPFSYDHSATDPDGDSLSYEFGPAFDSKKNFLPGGGVEQVLSPPPYDPVKYSFGFTAVKPITGNPILSINPKTGQILGTPNLLGRFVVSVYCHEWRNHVRINTVMREFQFEITSCSKAVVANIPQLSEEFNTYIVECRGFKVFFQNLSTGGINYNWDFGVEGTEIDTSSAFEPTFTYPDTGLYVVKLVVNRGSTCPDSISRFVKVFPSFSGHFNFSGLPCPNSPISFRDSSISTTNLADYWFWRFDDGDSSYVQNPVHYYKKGGLYNVVLISKNPHGCVDTVRHEVDIEKFKAFAGNDTIIVKGETLNFNASGGSVYLWTPATNLTTPFIHDPSGYYPDSGMYSYNVYVRSDVGCEGYDTINVWVVNNEAIFVPTGFSPNGDGRNDVLKPIGIGYRNINFFRVFNRWGKQVFYTTQWDDGWDGRINGEPQDIGTYYWVLSVKDRYGRESLLKGDSALIK